MAGKGPRGAIGALQHLNLASPTFKRAASVQHHVSPPGASSPSPNLWTPNDVVPVTIFDFPSYEPLRLEEWQSKHLHLPLRRDILHQAVVYEGSHTRQGTANSKTRYEVHGGHRKIHAQKGLGIARAGTKQSPIQRGGGKTFGPKPRDFGIGLNRKVYDLAWRTALSYRYRRGELTVCDDGMELPMPEGYHTIEKHYRTTLAPQFEEKWASQMLQHNSWGRPDGRSTIITGTKRELLFKAMEHVPSQGRALEVADVDVKDLLESGRLIVERGSLREMLEKHQSDLVTNVFVNGFVSRAKPPRPQIIVGEPRSALNNGEVM